MEDVYAQYELCKMVWNLHQLSKVERRVVETPRSPPAGSSGGERTGGGGQNTVKRTDGGATYPSTNFTVSV